jgi:uncharacterized membrane protein
MQPPHPYERSRSAPAAGHPPAGRTRFRAILAACLLLLGSQTFGQSGFFNQRDDKYPLLGLKRAKETYEVAQRDRERRRELLRQGLISQAELDRTGTAFADAEVNYHQSLLAVLFEKQVVSVSAAVKRQNQDGTKRVQLTLANTSGGGGEFQKLLGIDDALFRSLQPDVIPDVYVSLANDAGAIVSNPYEAKLEELRSGEPQKIEFALLQDLDAVTVNIYYGNGSSRTMKIYLQKDAGVNRVSIQSEQFSQEAELGKSATYDLNLELFGSSGRSFRLEVVNLPTQIDRFFKDPVSGARLTQVRFTQSSDSRRAALQVSLPDRATGEIPFDRPLSFQVLAVPEEEGTPGGVGAGTEDQLVARSAGSCRLELVPRGRGVLIVRAPQLYQSIRAKEIAEVEILLANEGTRRLDNIEVKCDAPLQWSKTVDPQVVTTLDVGEERKVRLTVSPARKVAPGRYEARIRTSALSDNRPVSAEDKTLTVEVRQGSNLVATILLVLIVVGLVVTVVVFGIRLSRK